MLMGFCTKLGCSWQLSPTLLFLILSCNPAYAHITAIFQGLEKCSIESCVRFLEKWLLAVCLPASSFSAVSLFPRERLSWCCTTLSIGQNRQTGSSSYNTSLLHCPHWWDSHSTPSRDIPVCSQFWKRLTCFQQLAGLAIPIKKLIHSTFFIYTAGWPRYFCNKISITSPVFRNLAQWCTASIMNLRIVHS